MEVQPSICVRQQNQKLMHQFTVSSVWPSVGLDIKNIWYGIDALGEQFVDTARFTACYWKNESDGTLYIHKKLSTSIWSAPKAVDVR